jgi:gamma-glutamylcyclotransferase (GGCT)/AIG2-like uncharacterized protein YtfP
MPGYFAYGSNMARRIMDGVSPTARVVGIARLPDHRLAFTRRSTRSGTGVADVVPAPGETVWGVVYEVDGEDLAQLDRKEGLGRAYERHLARVLMTANSGAPEGPQEVWIYTVLRKEPSEVPPAAGYVETIVRGAAERGLPLHYLQFLDSLRAQAVPDRPSETRTGLSRGG